MGMKSLFVQLDNCVVIAFITDHTAKSGILQVLTKNQEFMYYMLIESHNPPPPKKKRKGKVILTVTWTYIINTLLLFVEGFAEEM